ncbi:MAG: alpha,alpha-trehalase TreF [Ferruginibacter sp.]
MQNELLDAVQMNKIFPDGKTFVDCIPLIPEGQILEEYNKLKNEAGFDLRRFILNCYDLPQKSEVDYTSDPGKSVTENIESLWEVLTRKPEAANGSLIELPFPYIVPGGRFGEIYYWDSYFTMLGLQVSGRNEMIGNMVNNFAHFIDRFGYIPNGNRSYFLGRSQPPFFSLMVSLLEEIKGSSMSKIYLPMLEKEYAFWMKGKAELSAGNNKLQHTLLMPGGEILNRYWDENDTPRPESYREDVELAIASKREPAEIYRHLRAGAESGWDYSRRWFKDEASFVTINTADIVPVDLNCLLLHLEEKIAAAHLYVGNEAESNQFLEAAEKRKAAIQKYCWNETEGFYFDFDSSTGKQKNVFSLAAAYPLFFKVATVAQAKKLAAVIEQRFLHEGGLISSLQSSGQQWDAPNGWAPLHWITITGLENYGLNHLAETIARRWIQLCTDVFNRTGKLMEKYNVVDTKLEAGGGEYPGQDGFGWTNGVLLALIKKYGS